MLAIKNNMMAENAARQLGRSYDALARSVERLSSGLRINSARDDAAGLAVRELVRADVAQIRQASRNGQDAVSMLQTAEGAMGVIDEVLVRMKELAEQAATGSYSNEQRTIMNNEYAQLGAEITRIAGSTTFNGISLLAGTTASVSFHVGSGSISFETSNMVAGAAGLRVTTGPTYTDYKHASEYVASAGDIYFAADDIDTVGLADQIRISFGAGANIDVDLSAYDATGVSLNQLVQDINAAAITAGYSGPVAFAYYDETYGGYRLQLKAPAAGAGNDLTVADNNSIALLDAIGDLSGAQGIDDGSIDLSTQSGAETALAALTTAIGNKDTYRAKLGYMMNRLDSAVRILDIQAENLMSAESRISDVDVATEMAAMTRNQVLSQAGISMLAQANQMPQMALTLLRG